MTLIDETHLDTVVLLRLMVAPNAKRLSRSDVLRSLSPIVRGCIDAGAAKDTLIQSLERLEQAGLREKGRMSPTPDGERRALSLLGIERSAFPKTWGEVKALLVPFALGLPQSSDSRERVRSADALRSEIVRTRLGLTGGSKMTFASALNHWAARELGLDGKAFTLSNIRAHVLGRAIGLASSRSAKQLPGIVVAKLANARNSSATELREALLRDWLLGTHAQAAPESLERDAPLPLDRFAAIVRGLARDERSARFGRDKVFISSLWERAREVAELQTLDEASFKARLIDAHRDGLLRLSRADLTSAMSPSMVRDSEVPYLNAVFHFVNDEVSP
jgi:hypothetical protein